MQADYEILLPRARANYVVQNLMYKGVAHDPEQFTGSPIVASKYVTRMHFRYLLSWLHL